MGGMLIGGMPIGWNAYEGKYFSRGECLRWRMPIGGNTYRGNAYRGNAYGGRTLAMDTMLLK
jgi:hypothetical protein